MGFSAKKTKKHNCGEEEVRRGLLEKNGAKIDENMRLFIVRYNWSDFVFFNGLCEKTKEGKRVYYVVVVVVVERKHTFTVAISLREKTYLHRCNHTKRENIPKSSPLQSH